MLKHTIILISNANLLITTKFFIQDVKEKTASYLLEAYGNTTTSGDILNAKTFMASHEYFPVGTVIDIVNLKNKKVIQVIINDNEISDDDSMLKFTDAVAHALGMRLQETIDIKLLVITLGKIKEILPLILRKNPILRLIFGNMIMLNHQNKRKIE